MPAVVGQVLIAFAHRAEKSKKAVSKAFQPIVISSDDEDEDEGEDDDDDDDVEATPVPKSKTATGRRWGARVVVCAVEVLTYREFLRKKQRASGETVSGEAGSADRRGHRRAAGG